MALNDNVNVTSKSSILILQLEGDISQLCSEIFYRSVVAVSKRGDGKASKTMLYVDLYGRKEKSCSNKQPSSFPR